MEGKLNESMYGSLNRLNARAPSRDEIDKMFNK